VRRPLGTELEIELLKVFKKLKLDVRQDANLNHLYKVDFDLQSCPPWLSTELLRRVLFQVTTNGKQDVKPFDFNAAAKALDPKALRVYLEVLPEAGNLNFKQLAFTAVLIRLFCDEELRKAEFVRVTLNGFKTQVRVIAAEAGQQRLVGELQRWKTVPSDRWSECGFIYTPNGRKFWAPERAFRDAEELAVVRDAATARQAEGQVWVPVRFLVSFRQAARRGQRRGKEEACPHAVDVALLEQPASRTVATRAST
jgi:hypothetical protein